MISTEDFVQHDLCPRLRVYSSLYKPFTVSPNFALNESIHQALSVSNPIVASDRYMEFAKAGIDINATNRYDSAIHHSRLVELLATYILAIEKVSVPDVLSCKWGEFQPKSFLTQDGRLRRIVFCDRWNPDREILERFSWRTAADTAITNLPMVITAVIIGGLKDGFRPSPWTLGFEHPQTGEVRVQKREGKFVDSWREVYREETSLKPLDWLRIMQQDRAFEGRVFSITENPPANRSEVLKQLETMASEMGSLRQTRSACYRFRPCSFLPACSKAKSPTEMGWIEKDSLEKSESARLPVTI